MHKKSFEMINIGLISYILLLLSHTRTAQDNGHIYSQCTVQKTT